MNNADKPAMPIHHVIESCSADGNQGPYLFTKVDTGLTKREMFAMHFMAASRSRNSTYDSWEAIALDSIEMADALLKVLEK